MNVRHDRPNHWLGRVLVACLVLGAGGIAAFPFRRESPPPIVPPRRIASDSVRLVFRNQDITLQVNAPAEVSPAILPIESSPVPPTTHELEAPSPQLPELPAQYRSLLDPNSTTPQASVPPIAGRVMEPVKTATLPLREHVLVDGDSLERLAERYLGSALRANEIFTLNRTIIDDPQTLPLGRVIQIPSRQSAAQ